MVQYELVAIFDELLGQRARLRKSGTRATYHCPFCVDKNRVTQKLEIGVSGPSIGLYHCWRCDVKGGTFGSLLYKLQAPQSYRDAIFKLTGDIRMARYAKSDLTFVSLPHEFHPMSKPKNTPEYKNAMAYLKRRGIIKEDILRYNIGYCEGGGEYEYHIIVPSYDAKGVLNFFMGRRYYNDDPGVPHKKPDVPMNLVGFESFVNYNEPLNLCEGVFDAVAIRNNAIPLFGKYPSQALKMRMNENHVKHVNVILDLDAEKDSIKAYINLKKQVATLEEISIVKLNGKDPSVLGFEKIHELIRNSPPFDWSDLLKYELGI
jgi:hypothetical protein